MSGWQSYLAVPPGPPGQRADAFQPDGLGPSGPLDPVTVTPNRRATVLVERRLLSPAAWPGSQCQCGCDGTRSP